MKKRGVENLKLNKKSVSTLNCLNELKGGRGSALCTGLAGSCWCDITITDCCVR